MGQIKNTFSAVTVPRSTKFAGILEQAHILLSRLRIKKAEKSIVIVGHRGTGKTALLNEIERMAKSECYKTIFIATKEETPLVELLMPPLKKILFDLDELAGVGESSRGLRVLRSFIDALTLRTRDFELDVESEKGSADSGDIEFDLPILFETVAETALEQRVQIALLIDDIQYLSRIELSALILSMHKLQQRGLPLALICTGLPVLRKRIGNSKAYAERLFNFPNI